ncbi:MAG TPA: metal-dependent hydrolase, partial [Blastocatellia bacterium]|nr:metal-dependent hydrolase [Blastocatellia bacterium]
MMAATHALVGVTIASFATGTADPLHLTAAAISSQLPDVDTTRSLAGRLLLPFARAIERRFPHRTVTHSLLATVTFAALCSPVYLYSPQAWKAALWGYFCGWFADAFTKSGVAAFYPLSAARLVIPANPRLRLSSGSRAERGVAVVFLCLLGSAVHLNTKGGLVRALGSWMGQPEAVGGQPLPTGERGVDGQQSIDQGLPCSDSSAECLRRLGDLAVENCLELRVISQTLAYQRRKLWTSWLNADGLNPLAVGLRVARNLAGGGDRAAARLEIAQLER